MKRTLAAAALGAAMLLGAAAPAQGAFGLSDFDVFFAREAGSPVAASQAGSHPYSMRNSFGVNYSGEGADALPDGELKDATFTLPTGLAINPTATPKCSSADFLAPAPVGFEVLCPEETQIGEVTIDKDIPGQLETVEVFNLAPPPGSPARFGFKVLGIPLVIDGRIEPDPPYNLQGVVRNTRQVVKVFGADLELFGTVGDKALITLPTRCDGPVSASYEALSWQGDRDSGQVQSHDAAGHPAGFEGCGRVPFDPEISSRATTPRAAGPSGLEFELAFDQSALLDPGAEAAQSAIKDAVVTLPRGMTANPSLAEGLGACSPADLDRETLGAEPGEGCPQSSKIGVVEVRTPLLDDPLPGNVYIATPDDPAAPGAENPFNSLIAFYVVIKQPSLGVLVKLPAGVAPNAETGQLVTTVRDAPQLPVSSFSFRFREGARAPLIAPPGCGTHTTTARFTPWARPGEALERSASFAITQGNGGGPCPTGPAPFEPSFEAGTQSNAAATYSPLEMRIARPDANQDLTKLAATLPPGLLGSLAGLAQCPDAAIALAAAKSARGELAAPSCPPGSRIGSTTAAAGVGEALTYVPGSIYLAGPYNGAPLSVVAITPALAGPFDAGTVAVRVALRIDPRTARVSVDGAASDPIPHILKGIPLNLRELRVSADRPGFTLNPTSCDEKQIGATLFGAGTALEPLPESPVERSSRFQAAGCRALAFAPRLALQLRGGTRRGANPALRAILTPRPGQANFSRAVVTLPRSAFLEQAHIRTICTRVQFAAGPGNGAQCPPGSRYGYARAWTPLLDAPAQGPVYLRSSDNNLPDLVVALKGPASAPIDLELSARIDSIRGGIRSTFTGIPDAPVSRFILDMQGGRKGLIVNSRNLCFKAHRNRARANLAAQNGKLSRTRPVVRALACAKQRKAKRARHSRR